MNHWKYLTIINTMNILSCSILLTTYHKITRTLTKYFSMLSIFNVDGCVWSRSFISNYISIAPSLPRHLGELLCLQWTRNCCVSAQSVLPPQNKQQMEFQSRKEYCPFNITGIVCLFDGLGKTVTILWFSVSEWICHQWKSIDLIDERHIFAILTNFKELEISLVTNHIAK